MDEFMIKYGPLLMIAGAAAIAVSVLVAAMMIIMAASQLAEVI